jgi:hypothetical protein
MIRRYTIFILYSLLNNVCGPPSHMKLTALTGFLLALLLVFSSCMKEYSIESGQDISSSGTLKTISGNCLPSQVNGLFRKGLPVNDSDYINVSIDVTAPGYYSITSDTVNGVHFTGAGIFTAAGMTTVRLKAAGNPTSSGIFTFAITYYNSVCALDVSIADTSTSAATFSFNAGTGGTCMGATLNGTYQAGVAMNATNSVSLTINVVTAGTWAISTAATNGITFAGSGTLMSTGNQVVVLAASGTPLTAGSVNISAVQGSGSCTFSVTTQPSGTGTAAVFTLGGAGSTCTGATLGGTYKAQVPMTSANTASINVSVTTLGNYSISTPAMNGVTFTGIGTFAATGPQVITLTASGTPTAPGSFNFGVTANSATCTFPATFQAAAAPAVFTLSGAPLTCLTPVINGTYTAGVAANATNSVVVKVNVTTPGTYTIATNTVNGITFSASGVFATAGTAIDVTLLASGAPQAAGTNTFTPQAGSSTCTFDIITAAAAAGIYNCNIDGVYTSFYDRAAASIDDVGAPYLYLDGYIAPPDGTNIPELQIFINNIDGSPVGTGIYNVDGLLLPNAYRIEIDYKVTNTDLSVTIWNTSSSFFSPNPPFTINVTSVTASRVKGTFSGTLTNTAEGSTQQKIITGGVFDLPIQ